MHSPPKTRGIAPRAFARGTGTVGRARALRFPAVAASAALAFGLALTGCAAAHESSAPGQEPSATGSESGSAKGAGGSASSSSYGSMPSYLPKDSLTTDAVLDASAQHPVLTTEGDAVRFGTGHTAVIATVSGPEVPGEGLPYQAPSTTCTWTVTLTAGDKALPINVADFSSLDHLGGTYSMSPVPGQLAPPAEVAAHSTATFELRAVMVVGEGIMRWAPGGHGTVASWDFEVEND
jgi:hypothetical protein